MNELKVFRNSEFGEVRTVEINGQVYFVAIDIAKALGYKDTSGAIRQHCRWAVKCSIPHPQNKNKKLEVTVIPEGDLYRLIMKSQLPSAERFESWVCDEVLPQIRRTGAYVCQPDSYMIENPAERARRWAEEYEERKALEGKVNEMSPKAGYFDKLVDTNLLTNFRDTAKELHMSQTQFTGWLLERKYIYKDSRGTILPYEPYRERGLFQIKDYINPYNGFSGRRTYITPTGKMTFKMLLESEGIIPEMMKKHGGRRRELIISE